MALLMFWKLVSFATLGFSLHGRCSVVYYFEVMRYLSPLYWTGHHLY